MSSFIVKYPFNSPEVTLPGTSCSESPVETNNTHKKIDQKQDFTKSVSRLKKYISADVEDIPQTEKKDLEYVSQVLDSASISSSMPVSMKHDILTSVQAILPTKPKIISGSVQDKLLSAIYKSKHRHYKRGRNGIDFSNPSGSRASTAAIIEVEDANYNGLTRAEISELKRQKVKTVSVFYHSETSSGFVTMNTNVEKLACDRRSESKSDYEHPTDGGRSWLVTAIVIIIFIIIIVIICCCCGWCMRSSNRGAEQAVAASCGSNSIGMNTVKSSTSYTTASVYAGPGIA
jgi:hypothetical protein